MARTLKKPLPPIPLAKPWYDQREIAAASRVLASGWLISGPVTEAFENEFAALIGAKCAVAVNSGSSALLVVQAAAGVKAGDEVIVPNMTFVSTASSSLYLGARPVFCDITDDDYGLDPEKLEALITPRTKAILPVHYAGQTARMGEILEIAGRRGIPVLEDAAEAHLAKYGKSFAGTLGLAAIFSFTPSKPMTTGEGGMIVTDDAELAKRARAMRSFCDADKFRWEELGFNFRLPEALGAIGRVQLKKLPESVRRRRKMAARYTKAFAGLDGLVTPFVRRPEDHNFQLYTLRIRPEAYRIGRDAWIEELAKRRVSARLYYPTLHDQGVFRNLPRADASALGRSIAYSKTAFSIPLFASLTEAEQGVVIEAVRDVHLKFRS